MSIEPKTPSSEAAHDSRAPLAIGNDSRRNFRSDTRPRRAPIITAPTPDRVDGGSQDLGGVLDRVRALPDELVQTSDVYEGRVRPRKVEATGARLPMPVRSWVWSGRAALRGPR
jgi:hypothetical protein